jgi:hypothetical protein
MEPEMMAKRRRMVIRTVAVAVGLLGLYIVVLIARGVLRLDWRGELWVSVGFLFVFPIPAMAFGCYCLRAAYKTWGSTDVGLSDVRRISVVAAVMLGVLVNGWTYDVTESLVWGGLSGLLIMALGGAMYLATAVSLARWLGVKYEVDWKKRERAARLYCFIMAFLTCGPMFDIALGLVPKTEGSPNLPSNPLWTLASFAVPVTLAVVLYYAGMRLAMRGKEGMQNEK